MFLTFIVIVLTAIAATDTTCHCKGDCQQFPQSACTSCQSDWFGKFCQKRNIARGKETNQSSIYESSQYGGPYPSLFAVDGNTDNDLDHYSCTLTDDTNTDGAWWMVFLGLEKYNISQMMIFLRDSYSDRNYGFKVFVDDHFCFSVTTTSWTTLKVTCESPLSGNVVTVRINGTMLTLCEVQVFVCSDGWFGSDCDKQCQCSDQYEVCDKDTGYCRSECAAGKHGDGCQQVCSDGWFGSDCDKQCQCSDPSEVCDKDTGYCRSGCAAGKHGDGCQQECTNGYYGENCALRCGHCKADRSCNKTSGVCVDRCQAGFQMPFCKKCTDGYYGDNCIKKCGHCKDHICNKNNGLCGDGCQAGFQVPYCKTCTSERFGYDCSSKCGQCKDGQRCDITNGHCPQGCKPGYIEPECLQECANYMYGDNCSVVCNCMNQCEVCDKFTGACKTGYRTQTESSTTRQISTDRSTRDTDVPLLVVSCLFAAACVALVVLGGFYIRLKREFSEHKAKKEERYNSVDNVTEEPKYDVITESNHYVNT